MVLGSVAACASRQADRNATATLSPSTGSSRSADPTSPGPSPAVVDSTYATFVPHGSRSTNKVAFMFHGDGDRATTDSAIRVLKQQGVTASVFVLGRWLVEQPTVAKALLDAGHELGNHSYSHPDFRRATAAVIKVEIERCRDVLVKQTKSPGIGFLAPEVDQPIRSILGLAASAGYERVIGYDVDPRDWSDPGPETILRIVGSGSRPGSIVQLHLGHPETVQALPKVIAKLRARGLEPTSVTDLLAG